MRRECLGSVMLPYRFVFPAVEIECLADAIVALVFGSIRSHTEGLAELGEEGEEKEFDLEGVLYIYKEIGEIYLKLPPASKFPCFTMPPVRFT